MVQESKWGKIFIKIIAVIFTFIIAVLTYMSFFEHCTADINTYGQPRYVDPHRPVVYVGMATAGIIALLFLCHFIVTIVLKNTRDWKRVHILLTIASGLVCAASIFWIFFNDATPKFDQEILFNEAKIIAGYSKEAFNTQYFAFYPRNKVLVLIMAFMLRLFGESVISFRILNVIGAVILLVSVSLTTKKVWKEQAVTVVTTLFLAVYYPIIIYTCYLYGTLLSAAFGAMGVCAVVYFCENRKLTYIFLAAVSFPLAIQMHQSAAIVMIAAMFYMLIHVSKKTMIQTVACFLLFLAMVFASNKIGDVIYKDITGAELGEAVPTLADIYMGISAEDGFGGPGSQNNSNCQLFIDNNCDPEATNKDAWNRIVKIVSEYISGERDLRFFVDKTKFQWLDPTFGSRRIIETNYVSEGEPANSEAYMRVYKSSLRDVGFKIAVVGLIIAYSLNLFSAVYQLVKGKQNGLHFFIQILLLGGFVFQLLWESISRYCFSYFIWLIPGAAYGLVLLYQVLFKIMKTKRAA